MQYFWYFYTDQVKFPHGGAHARGHRSDVLVRGQTPAKERRSNS